MVTSNRSEKIYVRDILEKCINLDNTCLQKRRKEGSYEYVI